MSEANRGIDALYDALREAFRRQDVEGVLGLLTPDYALWAPGAPPMTAGTLRPQLAAAMAAYDVEPTFEREEQFVSGDLAVDCGWDVQTVRPRSGGPAETRRQRVFLVLRRAPDGVWRFARGISQPGPAV